MRWLWILSWILLYPTIAQQSSSELDSLKRISSELRSQGDVRQLAESLYATASYYSSTHDYDSAKYFYFLSLRSATDARDTLLLGKNSLELSIIYRRYQVDFDSAIYYSERALSFFKSLGDEQDIGNSYYNIGAVHNGQGNFPLALTNFQEAFKYYETTSDSVGFSKVYNSLGVIYSKLDDYPKSLEYHEKALEIKRSLGDLRGVGINHNNIGLCYKQMGEYEQSLNSYRKALSVEKQLDFPLLKASAMNNMGNSYELLGLLDSALYYQKAALTISTAFEYNALIGWANKSLSSIYRKKNDFEKSINHGERAYQIGLSSGTLELSKQTAEVLHQTYEATSDYANAYKYLTLFKNYSDSLFNADKIKRTAALEYKYDAEESNRIQELELQAQEMLFLSQIDDQKRLRNSVIGGLLLMIVVAIIVWLNARQKQRINVALEEKNKIISEQAENLKQLNATKDKFFSIISHDLRAPMGIFQGFSFMVKTMLEDKKYDKLEWFADEVGKTSRQVSQLLDNLLNWALKQRGDFPHQKENLNLKACANENLDIFNNVAQSKGIQITSDIDDTIYIQADRNGLSTIVRNLVNNALKFTNEGGEVKVSAIQEGDTVTLRFSDTGIGIEKDKLESLFEFEAKTSVGTGGEKGVGLGLQLVYDFVKLDGGTIKVESDPSKGTTFIVSLPAGSPAN